MKILTIGTSFITERFIDAIKEVEGAELAMVYSRSLEKAQNFVEGVKGIADLDAALASDEFDTVYVASPNTIHYEQSKKALLAGKHVICEKPFVSNVEQLKELIQIAKEKDLFLFEAITTIHLPNFHLIKENLKRVGEVRLVNCNFSQFSSRYPLYKAGERVNIFDPAFDGGALRDINVYNIHFTVGLFGEPQRYQYFANRGYNGVDTSGVLMMDYGTFKAVLIACKDSVSEYYGLIQGDEGTIKVHGASLGRLEHADFTAVKSEVVERLSIKQAHHMSYELRDFKEIIEKRDFAERDRLFEHSLKVLEIIESVEKDAA